MNRSKKSILANVDAVRSRKIDNNTVEYFNSEGARKIRLHDTDIFIEKDGFIWLNSGGWRTVTTKDRLNKYTPSGWRVGSEKGMWNVSTPAGRFPFRDGIVLKVSTGKAVNAKPIDKAQKLYNAHKRKVKAYIDGYAKKLWSGEMEKPSAGDCLYCQLCAGNEGQIIGGNEHLFSHIEEKYFVPSLILAAASIVPLSPVEKHDIAIKLHFDGAEGHNTFFHDDKNIRRILRKYFVKRGVYNV